MAKLSLRTHRVLRAVLLLFIAGGIGLALHRLRRTEDQVELTRYVERDLPPLINEERDATDQLQALLAEKKLAAPAARKRLVDDITPRLVRLHRRAEALQPTTLTVRKLAAEYLAIVDAWTEASRTLLHAIDDPNITGEAGMLAVSERVADAVQQAKHFDEQVVRTCEQHRLATPPQRR